MKSWERRVIERGTGTCEHDGCDAPAASVLVFRHGLEAVCEAHRLEVVRQRMAA